MNDSVRSGLVVLAATILLAGAYISAQFKFHPIRQAVNPWAGFTPKEIVRGDVSKKQVIFTFDGGEGSQSADIILDVLRKHGVTGTFFLTGKFVERNPDLVKRMVAEGHEIFDHTYDHPHLTELSPNRIAWELDMMSQTLKRLTGTIPGPYFRPPYGDRDPAVLAAAAKAGYRSVYWTDDALDWEESLGMTSGEVEVRILSSLRPGNIYLMHLGDTITGNILDRLFTSIENQGYRIVSLSQGL